MTLRHTYSMLLLLSFVPVFAANDKSIATDSIESEQEPRSLYDKIVDYFSHTNDSRSEKDFDISFIGGPHYSTDSKFGLGLMAAGVYRHDKQDRSIQPSNVTIYFDITTKLCAELGIRGIHIFPHDNRRLSYDVSFANINTKYWGIGYDMAIEDNNESKYKYLESHAMADFLWRITGDFYAGPKATFDYVKSRNQAKPRLWENQPKKTFNVGVGFALSYDSRDNTTAATKGFLLSFEQLFRPKFLANKYAFSQTLLKATSYNTLWKGAILASLLRAEFTYGNTPWGLMPNLGGSYTMRGYFEGRYRDKNALEACLELRQHVWHRNGVVAWIGVGTIFPEFKALRWRKVLPNYGFGYRWEFKKFMNVRLDLGFGRHQTGIIFSINEAF